MSVQPKTIVFCLPGRSFSGDFLVAWSRLLFYCQSVGHKVIISNAYEANVFAVRNKVLGVDVGRGKFQKPFDGKLAYDYLFWIDSDVIFNPEQVQQLIDHDKDIVSGCYIMANNNEYPICEKMDYKDVVKDGGFVFMNRNTLASKSGLFNVDYVGFGFVCIKHGVFEKMEYPYFRAVYHEIPLPDGTIMCDYSSEDVSWCIKARELGFDIWVDPAIKVGHEKTITLR